MSAGFEREVAAALHRAADELSPPRLDLDRIRRAGRRRRARAVTAAALAAAVVTVGAVTGALHLPSPSPQPPPGPGHRSASPTVSTGQRSPAVTPPEMATAIASVRAFYGRYDAARRHGRGAVDALIRSRVASWYVPILQAPSGTALDPVECGVPAGAGGLAYQPAGVAGGQAVIVVGSRLTGGPQAPHSVVTADRSTGKITGITCAPSSAGNDVTRTGARDETTSLYLTYIPARRQGTSLPDALARLLAGGPDSASPYLQQVQHAVSRRALTYDPLLCTSSALPSVTVGAVTIVASGSAGVVVLTPGHAQPIVAVVVLGAKGWTVADIACHQP